MHTQSRCVLPGFQSTPSVWRATEKARRLEHLREISIHALRVEGDILMGGCTGVYKHFNPRPPCGGRLATIPPLSHMWYFNPRPPCGGRPLDKERIDRYDAFQSTPSVWRATVKSAEEILSWGISIHALRVEGDVATI